MEIKTVAKILMRRAYIFTCSYRTAWVQWMEQEEKSSFKFDEIFDYIIKFELKNN